MTFDEYLYKLVQFRIAYILPKMRFYQEQLNRESWTDADEKKAAQARVDEWGYEANRLEWLLQCAGDGGDGLAVLLKTRSQWKWALKGLFKFAKRCKSNDDMPQCESSYTLLGCWAAEELL